MPIYEYHCKKCGDFEVMQKISDKELRTCPTCRRKVTKLISNTTFHLKGSGWYITDYARKGQGKGGESESAKPESSKTESKSETSSKSESKSKSDSGKSKGKKGSKAKSAA